MCSRSPRLFQSLRYLSTLPNQTPQIKPYSEVPGPKSYPLIKGVLGFSAPEVGSDPKEAIVIMKHLWKTYGDIVRLEVPGRPTVVFIFNPDTTEKMYRAAGAQPIRPGFDALRYVRENDPLTNQASSKGLLTSNKQDWYTFRSRVQQPMLRPKSTLRYTPDLEDVVDEFIQKKILAQRNSDFQVGPDFLDDMYKWALESVTVLALNARLGCLEPNVPEDSDQMKIIRAVSDIFKTSSILDNGMQLWRFLPSPKLNQFKNGYDVFRDLCYKYISAALNDIKIKNSNEGDPTLLELLFDRGCDENTAVVMAIDMIFAGIDTSSHTSAFLMYQLAKNPQVQEKLHSEIKTELPNKDSKLDLKALERMPYLKACLKEVFRTNPPTTANARIIEEPMELGGYQFPPGLVYVPCHYVMGTSERYIEQADTFRPERWLRNSPDKAKIHPFLMMPFGHGPRMCVGRRFAEQEVMIFIAKILQHFRIEWEHEDMVMKVETLTKPFTPLRFTFIDREE